MIGAVIGDIAGSTREFRPLKTKDFEFFTRESTYTDDTLMTLAVWNAFEQWREGGDDSLAALEALVITSMRDFASRFPLSLGGYGGRFSAWLSSQRPEPYNSWGNGAAMRVSAAGYFATDLSEALTYAAVTAKVTHNHPEGIKGAQATAGAIFLAREGASKDQIRDFVSQQFYSLDFSLDEIRPDYGFDVSCQGTVPPAVVAFLESSSFEDAVRNAISLGGDADTLGAITGSIAWPYYEGKDPGMQQLADTARGILPPELRRGL